MTSRFHDEALGLLGLEYRQDPLQQAALERREKELGVRFPASFAEWYAMQDGVAILRKHSNCDDPLAIDELGDPRKTSWAKVHSDQILPFMIENQGVSLWGLRLDAGDDPPVVVAVDPDYTWVANADCFSTFVTSHVWDHARCSPITWSRRRRIHWLRATSKPCALTFLNAGSRTVGPRTHLSLRAQQGPLAHQQR